MWLLHDCTRMKGKRVLWNVLTIYSKNINIQAHSVASLPPLSLSMRRAPNWKLGYASNIFCKNHDHDSADSGPHWCPTAIGNIWPIQKSLATYQQRKDKNYYHPNLPLLIPICFHIPHIEYIGGKNLMRRILEHLQWTPMPWSHHAWSWWICSMEPLHCHPLWGAAQRLLYQSATSEGREVLQFHFHKIHRYSNEKVRDAKGPESNCTSLAIWRAWDKTEDDRRIFPLPWRWSNSDAATGRSKVMASRMSFGDALIPSANFFTTVGKLARSWAPKAKGIERFLSWSISQVWERTTRGHL